MVDCLSDPGLCRIWCCMVLHLLYGSEVIVSVSNELHILVYPLVRSEHRTIDLHKGVLWHNTCLPVCGFAWFRIRLLQILQIAKDCISHDGCKHLVGWLTHSVLMYNIFILRNHALSCFFHATWQLRNSPGDCGRELFKLKTLKRCGKSCRLHSKNWKVWISGFLWVTSYVVINGVGLRPDGIFWLKLLLETRL